MFRLFIRHAWYVRAQLYFDAHDSELPYIIHRYTSDNTAPHTYGDLNRFHARTIQSFTDRNPLINRSCVNNVLNIHAADGPGYDAEYDLYAVYDSDGMHSAQYYIENHISQFYRIIFFFQELRERGISCDDDDMYPEALPYDVVPEDVQAIIYNDSIYRDYLSRQRRNLLAIDFGNVNAIRQNLVRSTRVYEEDLLVVTRLISSRRITRTTTTTTTTTSTTVSSTTTSKAPNEHSKKGSVYVNDYGKHFVRQSIEFCKSSGDDNSNEMDTKKFTEYLCQFKWGFNFAENSSNEIVTLCSTLLSMQQLEQRKPITYGFVVHNGDLNQLLFSEKE